MEVVLASSPVDAGIACWDLRTGAEQLRFRSCASSRQGLVSVARRFIASAQIRNASPAAASAPIFFWSWDKPQVEVRSFPAEPIGPLVADSAGAYLVGGASSGTIYLWELASGRLLNRWNAHYRAVTCLTLSDDESMLISGSADGSVRVWSLLMIFDNLRKEVERNLYTYSFSEHTLPVTGVISGNGSCNAIIISSSEDRTCKIWNLSEGRFLRSISFPSIIDAIAMDPAEHAFYAGSRDGKIYIAALSAESNPNSSNGMHIIGSLSDHSKAITCLAFSVDGVTLVSGSEDGTIRLWDTKSRHVTRVLKHAKGPVNNVVIVKQPLHKSHAVGGDAQGSQSKKHSHLSLPPSLDKFIDTTDAEVESKALLRSASHDTEDSIYCSFNVMENQIKEFQQQGSSGAVEMELERLRLECRKSMQMVQKWKKLYLDLQDVCVKDMMNEVQMGDG